MLRTSNVVDYFEIVLSAFNKSLRYRVVRPLIQGSVLSLFDFRLSLSVEIEMDTCVS